MKDKTNIDDTQSRQDVISHIHTSNLDSNPCEVGVVT